MSHRVVSIDSQEQAPKNEEILPQISPRRIIQNTQGKNEEKKSQEQQPQHLIYAQHRESSIVTCNRIAENSDNIDNEEEQEGTHEFDDNQVPTITIDYLKDLDTQISSQQLKKFLLDQLQEDELTFQQLYNLIKEGAQLNNFIHINDSIIRALIKSLDLQLDTKVKLSARQKFAQNTKKIVNAKRFIKGIKQDVIQKKQRRRSTYVSVKFKEDLVDQFLLNSSKNLSSQNKRKKKSKGYCCIFDQVCKAYSCLLLLTVVSIGIFCVSGFTVPQAIIDFAGAGIIFARGSAITILVMALLSVMYITRDFIACMRLKCFRRRCVFLLDEHVLYHQFCAILCVVYTVVHVFGHCFGPVMAISQADTVDVVNAILKNGSKIYRLYSYQEILFQTLPGFTGFLLTIDIFLLFFLSLPCVRRRKWEIFSYSHMILYWFFMLGMILHGCATWFNPGVPFSFPFMIVASGLVVFQLGKRICQKKYAATQILSYQMTKNNEYIYIKLSRPISKDGKKFTIRAGQYMMLAIPDISPLQWHPFSICSGEEDSTINFIIKDIGNFTKKLIQLSKKNLKLDQRAQLAQLDYNTIITQNMDQENQNGGECVKIETQKNPKTTQRILNESGMHLATQEARFRKKAQIVQERKKIRIYINGPFSAPCQSAINNKCVIFFGAGVGITPFLSYLKTDPPSIQSLNFVFICRDPQLMKWITLTLDEMQYQPHVRRNITIYLFLTRRKQAHCLASFVFWRAFLQIEKLQKEYESQRDILYDLPIKISYMRPDLKGIIREISDKYIPDDDRQKIVSMYSCAPDSFNQRLRKISKEVQKGSKTKYYFYPEIFG